MAKAQTMNAPATPPTVRPKSDYCPHDGSRLTFDPGRMGYCRKADGFPMMAWFPRDNGTWDAQGRACPFVCPHCGNGLEWDGGCTHCQAGGHGAAPGDRYRREHNHWVWERGPEKAITEERRQQLIIEVRETMRKIFDRPTRQQRPSALGG